MQREIQDTAVDERREASRFNQPPDTYFAVMNLDDGRTQLGEVFDESLGGLGLLFRDDLGLSVGLQVELIYLGQLLYAEVRHIEPADNGFLHVGFRCRPQLA